MDRKDSQLVAEWDGLVLNDRAGAVRFSVRVRPRSSRSSILGVREGLLEVALNAAPTDGLANEELRKVVARALGVRAIDVSIVVGTSSRTKVLEVNGTSSTQARDRLRHAKR
jgi:hypothetical protein